MTTETLLICTHCGTAMGAKSTFKHARTLNADGTENKAECER